MTGQPLRIAMMLESDGPGGAEMMVFRLAEELRRRGHSLCQSGRSTGSDGLAIFSAERACHRSFSEYAVRSTQLAFVVSCGYSASTTSMPFTAMSSRCGVRRRSIPPYAAAPM